MKNIYLICGRSGSGKSTIVNSLISKYSLKAVESYTTRPKRYKEETGHTFVDKTTFDALDLIAYTFFNGYEYGVTKELLFESDLYIIDIEGIKYLKDKYKDKYLKTIYLDVPEKYLIERMKHRGDTQDMIQSRLENDANMFKEEKDFNFDLIIDARKNIEELTNIIYQYIKEEENHE